MKPKLKIIVGQAKHFLKWELPFFQTYFQLVKKPGKDTILFVFGPDVLRMSLELPSLLRVAMLFPGFGFNPYHNLEYRKEVLDIISTSYDLVFVNPGPLSKAFQNNQKVKECPFSVDTQKIRFISPRKSLNSLLHVSADYPHKDWKRSAKVMQLTGLDNEIFPPRNLKSPIKGSAFKRRINRVLKKTGFQIPILPDGYVSFRQVVNKYRQYDGFVHIAKEFPNPVFLDGKYTATILEAGLTGAILFWHDTFNLGNDFGNIFNLPVEPVKAAEQILQIRKDLDVEKHSRFTRDEILDKCSSEKSVGFRCLKIKELL